MTRTTRNARTFALLALAGSLAVAACERGRDTDEEGGVAAQPVVAVRTIVAVAGDVRDYRLALLGTTLVFLAGDPLETIWFREPMSGQHRTTTSPERIDQQ